MARNKPINQSSFTSVFNASMQTVIIYRSKLQRNHKKFWGSQLYFIAFTAKFVQQWLNIPISKWRIKPFLPTLLTIRVKFDRFTFMYICENIHLLCIRRAITNLLFHLVILRILTLLIFAVFAEFFSKWVYYDLLNRLYAASQTSRMQSQEIPEMHTQSVLSESYLMCSNYLGI